MDEILDSLRPLLFLRERHLQDLPSHPTGGASILGGIADQVHLLSEHDVVYRPQGAIQRHLHRVLEGLVVRRLIDDLAGWLFVLNFFVVALTALRLLLSILGVVMGGLAVADVIDFVVFLI